MYIHVYSCMLQCYKKISYKIMAEKNIRFSRVTMSRKLCHNVTLKVMLLLQNGQQYSLRNALKWFSDMSLLIKHTLFISNISYFTDFPL